MHDRNVVFLTGAFISIGCYLWKRKRIPNSYLYRRCPATIGMSLHQVETPCLVVDLDEMEENLRRLPQTLKAYPKVKIRPHAKAHKSAELGKLQLKLSEACGLCCQKIVEAEAMVHGGITDILVSNELVGASRYSRMAKLAKKATITLVFDNAIAIEQASLAATAERVQFRALVDINVGQNRCGVDSKEEAYAMASLIMHAPGLEFVGIQAYHGAAQHIRDYEEKSRVIATVAKKAENVVNHLKQKNISCDVVTGGGTGTYLLEAQSGIFTEVQPGSYVFNDADYARNLNAGNQFDKSWRQSLFVLSTVMSKNVKSNYCVVDAGLKAVSMDSGVPLVRDYPDDVVYENGGDEHGKLIFPSSIALPALGRQLFLIPGHCDPTVNMYDYVIGYRKDKVETIWSIDARSPGN